MMCFKQSYYLSSFIFLGIFKLVLFVILLTLIIKRKHGKIRRKTAVAYNEISSAI